MLPDYGHFLQLYLKALLNTDPAHTHCTCFDVSCDSVNQSKHKVMHVAHCDSTIIITLVFLYGYPSRYHVGHYIEGNLTVLVSRGHFISYSRGFFLQTDFLKNSKFYNYLIVLNSYLTKLFMSCNTRSFIHLTFLLICRVSRVCEMPPFLIGTWLFISDIYLSGDPFRIFCPLCWWNLAMSL